MMLDADKLRKDFPVLERKVNGKGLVYFDNTATAQKPIQVIDAISDYYKNNNANIHRGVHTLSQEASDMYDNGRENLAGFVGCRPEEMIFTRNATESLNLVSYSWGLQNLNEGDEIIITSMEHHSNIIPWHFLQKSRGIKVRALKLKDGKGIDIDEINELVTPKTKMIAFTHFSNVLGTIIPAKKICALAKDNGILSSVDGAQSAPHMKIDVKDIGCDFFSFSAHKMIGPTGIGGLYVKEDILENMPPFNGGGGMIKDVFIDSSTYDKPPGRFEAGTPNIAGVVGFSAAVDYLNKVGMENIEEYEQEINDMVIKKMTELDDVIFYGSKDIKDRGAVFSFNIKGANPHDVAMLFDQQGIALRSGHHCAQPLMQELGTDGTVRSSPYLYNTKEEVELFLEVLEVVLDSF